MALSQAAGELTPAFSRSAREGRLAFADASFSSLIRTDLLAAASL